MTEIVLILAVGGTVLVAIGLLERRIDRRMDAINRKIDAAVDEFRGRASRAGL